MRSFIKQQFETYDGLNLSIFRFLFGCVIFWEMGRLILWNDYIQDKYLNTVFHFKFPCLEWVKQAPDLMMYFLIGLAALLSLLFAIGIQARIVTPLLFLLYTYLETIDLSYWNNHYYFYELILFLFIFIPPSISITQIKNLPKSLKGNFYWQLNLLKFMVICVLFYGGVSKLINPDWMSGEACKHLLTTELEKKNIELSQNTLGFLSNIMTWGGLWLDLIGGFLLLWRRTFWLALLLLIPFNLVNSFLFNIGSFPYAMLGTLVLFLPLSCFKKISFSAQQFPVQKWKLVMLSCFVLLQLGIPLRHFLIDGNVIWTGEGKLFGWHMMSSTTSYDTKYFYAHAIPPDGKSAATFPIDLELYLNQDQIRCLSKFPFVAPQFAEFAKRELEIDGFTEIKIYGEVFASKNGKPLKPIIDPYQDLTAVNTDCLRHNSWILLYLDEGY